MKQIFHPYWEWEDFHAGMWKKLSKQQEIECLQKVIDFTGDHIKYGDAMLKVIKEWPITMEHNLTDESINKKAFVGHCAVCLELAVPEYITRMAWVRLTTYQQMMANKAAENAINERICNYTGEQKCKGYQLELTF